jgi:hypothetical protein
MTDHRAMRLGKQPPKHDRRTLTLAKYLAPGVTPPTAHWDNLPAKGWGMMANDTVGDCTCATAGHMLQAWTSSDAPHVPLTATDDQVLAAYSAVTGYTPSNPDSDQGAYCLDVLNYWRHTGIAGRQVVAYMKVDPTNDTEIRTAIWAFGGCYLGLALPLTAARQDVWSVPLCRWCGKSRPGSWGGHAVPLVAYNKSRLWCVTWGEAKQLTYGFVHRYCDEAYAILSTDWTGQDRLSPSGFDHDALLADLNAIGA